MDYSTRRTLLEKEKTYRLGDDALEVLEEGAPPLRVPFADFESVRLSFLPSRYHSRIYGCEIRARGGGGRIRIFNTHMAGLANFEDRSDRWSPFIRELHRRLLPHARSIRFRRGTGAFAYGCTVLSIAGAFALLVFLLFFVLGGHSLSGSQIAKVAILLFLLPLAFAYLRRNRPTPYAPESPPPELLP
jgi:hypothetical protein